MTASLWWLLLIPAAFIAWPLLDSWHQRHAMRWAMREMQARAMIERKGFGTGRPRPPKRPPSRPQP